MHQWLAKVEDDHILIMFALPASKTTNSVNVLGPTIAGKSEREGALT